MSWSIGLMVVLAVAVGVPWLIAEALAPPRDWIKRLRRLEAGRQAQARDEYTFRRTLGTSWN